MIRLKSVDDLLHDVGRLASDNDVAWRPVAVFIVSLSLGFPGLDGCETTKDKQGDEHRSSDLHLDYKF